MKVKKIGQYGRACKGEITLAGPEEVRIQPLENICGTVVSSVITALSGQVVGYVSYLDAARTKINLVSTTPLARALGFVFKLDSENIGL